MAAGTGQGGAKLRSTHPSTHPSSSAPTQACFDAVALPSATDPFHPGKVLRIVANHSARAAKSFQAQAWPFRFQLLRCLDCAATAEEARAPVPGILRRIDWPDFQSGTEGWRHPRLKTALRFRRPWRKVALILLEAACCLPPPLARCRVPRATIQLPLQTAANSTHELPKRQMA